MGSPPADAAAFRAVQPTAGILVSSQNPQKSPQTGITAHPRSVLGSSQPRGRFRLRTVARHHDRLHGRHLTHLPAQPRAHPCQPATLPGS